MPARTRLGLLGVPTSAQVESIVAVGQTTEAFLAALEAVLAPDQAAHLTGSEGNAALLAMYLAGRAPVSASQGAFLNSTEGVVVAQAAYLMAFAVEYDITLYASGEGAIVAYASQESDLELAAGPEAPIQIYGGE